MRAQQFREAEDRVHRRANLVRHVSEEFALGRVGSFGLLPCGFSGFLGRRQLRILGFEHLTGFVLLVEQLLA